MKAKGLVISLVALALNSNTLAEPEITFSTYQLEKSHTTQDDEHNHILNPEQVEEFYRKASEKSDLEIYNFKFPQEYWYECSDEITGNFSNYKCASRRGISTILYTFMNEHLTGCVQEALDLKDQGTIEKLHVVHNGILGDRRHSPKSMHAENRAIDIKTFQVTTTDRKEFDIVYADKKNREFFTKFRTCWGEVVVENNGCPVYKGSLLRTGSIGWEDKNHQYHMHTSVPYCVNGRYGSYYYKR